ncbi:hypothetical protein PRIPAC_80531, partial [Pristionchus pacificus]
IGSGMIAFGHMGLVVTEFTNSQSIFSGYGDVYWCQLVNAYGLGLHPCAFFILTIERLILVISPHFLDFLNKFADSFSFLIAAYCFGYASVFTVIIYFTHYGLYLTGASLCFTLFTIPIACIGYYWISTKYRRTVAVLKLNVRYELSTIRELTRVVYPIVIIDALL